MRLKTASVLLSPPPPPASASRRGAHLDGQGHQRPLRVEPQQAERGGHILEAAVEAVDRGLGQDPVVG